MAKKVKIRKGDTVQIITGRREDKGKRGEVIKVLPKVNRLVVQGVNLSKKHQRQYQYEGRTLETGIIEFEAPLSISNVMLVCPSCNEPTRVGIDRDDEGVLHRVCKKCQAEID
jgi:large subunit ribosomal protein L24